MMMESRYDERWTIAVRMKKEQENKEEQQEDKEKEPRELNNV